MGKGEGPQEPVPALAQYPTGAVSGARGLASVGRSTLTEAFHSAPCVALCSAGAATLLLASLSPNEGRHHAHKARKRRWLRS